MPKIGLCQINPTVGDVLGNISLMQEAAATAVASGARVLVFPELTLTGYYPADMLDERGFIDAVQRGIAQLVDLSRSAWPGVYWVFGTPLPRTGPGKSLHNALLVIRDGEVLLTYAKQLLPTYDVFDERRHFEPGPVGAQVLDVDGLRTGFVICEDGWNEDGLAYEADPFKQLAAEKVDLVISINASPSNTGKRRQRHKMFTRACDRHGFSLLYVNQVGGQDQLVFDGSSFAVQPGEGVVFEAARFAEDAPVLLAEVGPAGVQFTEVSRSPGTVGGEPLVQRWPLPRVAPELPLMEFYRQQIVLGLRDYARRCGFTTAVVGSSGGIDSALTLALAVEALGAENVTAVTLPSPYSSVGSVDDSVALCENLGVALYRCPIEEVFMDHLDGFSMAFKQAPSGLTQENLQARIRGTLLMAYSNHFGSLLLTTGNKSELSVGYCTLYGDTNGGLGLIGDLYKTEVFELCRHINAKAGVEIIPWAIIEKPPSAELAPGQRDDDSLPPYEVLDDILKLLIEGARLPDSEYEAAFDRVTRLKSTPGGQAVVDRVKQLLWRSEYKRRQAPPIIRLRARAFGNGRQMPIAAVHNY